MKLNNNRYLLSGLISTFLSVLFVYLICILINKQVPTELFYTIEKLFTVNSNAFRPEPLERLRFIIAVITTPIFIMAFFILTNRLLTKFQDETLFVPTYILYSTISGILIYLLIIYYRSDDLIFFVQNNYLFSHPWLMCSVLTMFCLITYYFLGNKTGQKVFLLLKQKTALINGVFSFLIVAYIAFIAVSCIYSVYSIDDSGMYSSHFNATFHSMVMVYLGDNLLIDSLNQYGLYPHFLEIIFSIFGLSILKFTVFMSVLVFLNFYFIYKSLDKIIGNKLFVMIGFSMILFYGYMHLKLVNPDPYFQYFPIRTIFPSLLLYLSVDYFQNKNRVKYFVYTGIFSMSILWNVDTGLIVFLTWLLTLIYDEMQSYKFFSEFTKKSIKHVIFVFLSLLGIILVYYLLIFLRSGQVPNLYEFVKYQVYFYGYGFFMLPMKIIHPWNIIAFVYLLGLVFSVKTIFTKENTVTSKIIFLASILGVGLFSYYQGRSHDHVLANVWYPAFFLMALFTYKFYKKLQNEFILHRKNWLDIFVFLFLMFFLLVSFFNLIFNSGVFYSLINERGSKYIEKRETPVTSGVEFVMKNTTKGERNLILSYHSGIYYLSSHMTPGIGIPGMSEIFLESDYEKMNYSIKNRQFEKVFVDLNFLTDIQLNFFTNLRVLNELVKNNYYFSDRNTFGNILMLEKGGSDNIQGIKEQIPEEPNSNLHYSIYGGAFGYDLKNNNFVGVKESLPPINLNQQFSIELVLKPSDSQVPYAALIGNHPGNGYQGFIIQQDNDSQNLYNFYYGDGSKWSLPLVFSLETNEMNFLVITNDNGIIKVYINGKLSETGSSGLKDIENSDLPLSVGNWMNMDRGFAGEINEVQILNEVLTPEEISNQWELVNGK